MCRHDVQQLCENFVTNDTFSQTTHAALQQTHAKHTYNLKKVIISGIIMTTPVIMYEGYTQVSRGCAAFVLFVTSMHLLIMACITPKMDDTFEMRKETRNLSYIFLGTNFVMVAVGVPFQIDVLFTCLLYIYVYGCFFSLENGQAIFEKKNNK